MFVCVCVCLKVHNIEQNTPLKIKGQKTHNKQKQYRNTPTSSASSMKESSVSY